ncbi:uncharacterized protein LOC135484496 [Lineus longissimus]|uniref:uncharacterized protein LOC135484496 n=1 Tax=Lineus longissimus TaxID=88925 RepID=UPI00315DBFF1
MNAGCGSRPCTFFQLARVYALGNNGRWIPTVAFLDSASEITIIDKSLAKDLGLKGKSKQLTVKTLNAETTEMSQTVTMQLKPVNDPDGNSIRVEEAWVVGDSHFQCPSQRVSADWEHLNGLGLSDIDSSEVKLLIGINVARAHLQFDTRIGEDTQPSAVKTPLGWTLLGTSDQATSLSANVNIINAKDAKLKEEIERFWRSESFGVRHAEESSLSIEDRKAIQILEETTRLVNGHYEIGMLWRDSESPLPDNKSIASKRHYLLEKKLNRDEDVKRLYTETLEGYVSKGFARKLSEEEAVHRSPKTWYIPHHGMTNVNKPGKIRVVFDAAATCQGISLNDTLMTGPDLLNSLFGVLQRFRVYKIAISADIEAMFHQVRVPSHDADALRFLWKGDTFSMGVHIFGAKDSPTCANYALKRCAMDNIHKYSQEAAETVLKSFYVDDLAKPIHGVQAAIGLAQEVTNICAEGGFRICKWLSNSLEFLESIEESEHTINPPASPHMGGAWESLVKSVKRAMNSVLPKQNATDSVLRTVLVEVESVINSRPLTHNSDDQADYTALTPNHFLIGRAVVVSPPDVVSPSEINSWRWWRRVQVIADHVCKRWLREYLPMLTVRRKWLKEERNLAEGDLVIVRENNLLRGSWEMARVVETYPGNDGRVRSVMVKTPKATYVRPVARIALLEENISG